MVLRDIASVIACGSVIGAGVSLWASTFIGSLLFGVDARDPLTLIGAATVLAAVGLSAGWLPAWIASRENPAEVLRS
jgi:ABC-type antimicrobial peptide transport system permease subunit